MTVFLKGLWSKAPARRAIAGLGVIALLAELGYATMNQSALQPYVVKELKLSAGWLGWILATFLLVEALFRPALGALGDRVGRRPLLIAGPIASCAAAFLTARAVDPAALISLRILDGLGAAAIWPTAFALVGDTVDEKNRSVAMSVLNVTYMAGIALGPLVGGAVSEYTGSERYVFYTIGGMFALTVIIALAAIPKRTAPHRHETHLEEPQPIHLSSLLYSLRAIPEMLAMVFFAFGGVGVLIPIVKLYAMDELGLTEKGYGWLLLPAAATLAVLAMPLGRLGDKWGKVRSVRLGVLIAATAMWVIATTRAQPALVLGGSLLGVGFLMAMPAWLALISEMTSSSRRGEILGTVGMAQGLGAILGAIVGGHMYEGSISVPFVQAHSAPLVLSAIMLSVSTILTFIFLRRKPTVQK
ncbi:MAG: MFS transporter [Armatimonadota bacterium]|nr:MFS transporter [Armatimonadota bacterium]